MFPALKERLKRARNHSMPYDLFIQYALYDENDGYYNQDKTKVGKRGDFYTSGHIHKVFSQVLANYFISISQSSEARVFSTLEEWAFERKNFKGVIFSNEWLDAQPVKVVTNYEGKVCEVYVRLCDDDTLEEVFYPCSVELEKWMEGYGYHLVEGQRLELPLYMERLLSQLDDLLEKGVVVTVDYGYTSEELMHPSRLNGSLRGYSQHQMQENVLEQPGSMDITHHVHWDTWVRTGEKYGLQSNLMKQKDFLLEAGILNYLTEHASNNPFSEEHKLNRAIRSFIMGDQIANAFEVCVQEKGIDSY